MQYNSFEDEATMTIEEIRKELQSPEKAFRLHQLEKIMKSGRSPELIDLLREALRDETEPECRMFYQHAIQVVESRINRTPEPDGPLSQAAFEKQYSEALLEVRRGLIARIPTDWGPQLARWAFLTFSTETDPVIRTTLLRQFGRLWPAENGPAIAALLESPTLSLRYAAIETLAFVNLPLLVQSLPALLSSADPRTRALAITGLSLHDPEEAAKHLEDILLSRDPSEKRAGLQAAVVLPFELSKPALLQFLTHETSPDLLKQGGLAFQINPDPEVPFRLLALLEESNPAKAPLLKEILNGAYKTLEESGILKDAFPRYVEKIRAHIEERKHLRFIRRALDLVQSDIPWEREEGLAALRKNRDKPGMLEAMRKFLALPLESTVLEQLAMIAQPTSPSSPTPPEQVVTDYEQFRRLPGPIEKAQWLAGLQPEEKAGGTVVISAILRDKNVPIDTKTIALRAARRLDLREFVAYALEWVKSEDEMQAMSALEYLAAIGPERVLPMLTGFLRDPRRRLRTTAGKLLKEFDQEKAIEYLINMLRNPDSAVKKSALACLPYFEFVSIREPLLEILENNSDSTTFESILCLFQINPDQGNLLPLYRLQKKLPEAFTGKIQAVFDQTLALLPEMGVISASQAEILRRNVIERYEKERRATEKPALYSLKSVKASRPPVVCAAAAPTTTVFENAQELFSRLGIRPLPVIAMACLFLAVLSGAWLLRGTSEEVRNVESSGILSLPVEILGTVTDVFPDRREFVLKTIDETVFQVSADAKFPLPEPGALVKAVVAPFRCVQGRFLARLESLEKPE